MHVFGLDRVHHPHFAWLPVRILVRTQIFLRHPVEMNVGVLVGRFDRVSSNLQITIGVFGINDHQRYSSVTADVTVLMAASGRIEDYCIAIEVAPDGCDSGRSVGSDGRKVGERAPVEQIAILGKSSS